MARTEIPAPVHAAGETLHGFRIETVTSVDDIKARCYEAVHEKTGARLLHVHADDEENLFSVGFVTLPEDSSGVAHILEHCVLAGSDKFPVKDAFNELGKRTLNTFLNAMTWPDRTVYPVCSAVPKDLRNLMEVYLDLVFHPKLTEQTFQQEGHHLELAEAGDLKSPLTVSGVVYNEMHGVYSSPEAVVQRTLQRTLLPDSAYGVDSGGDPDRIPELTWEALRAFHKEHYHPGNARFVLYGDIPLSEHLEFLDAELAKHTPQPFEASARRQSRWEKPRTATVPYSVGPDEETTGKSYVVVSWLLGDTEDSKEALLLDVLAEALTGNSAGPLRKALIESGLGKDLFPGYLVRSGLRQVTAATGLRGTEAEHAETIETLVLDTLRKVAEEGLDRELIEAAFHQIEYAGKAIVPPFPIMLLVRAMPQWIYSGDPKRGLMFATDVEAARTSYEANPRLFEELIERWFLTNPHRLLLTGTPSKTLAAEQKAAREGGLQKRKAALSESELAAIDQGAQALTKAQREPDTAEAIATLPALAPEDIPDRVRHVPTEETTLGERPLLKHASFSNGIGYVGLAFDVSDLPNEFTPYLPLLGKATLSMGAAGQPWTEVTKRIAATAGSIQLSPFACRAIRKGDVHRGLAFDAGALTRKAEPLADLFKDLLTASDLSDRKRLAELVLERQSRLRSRLAPAGHRFAYQLAAAALTPQKAAAEACDGISQLL
ncbi:MAG: insulinase family protein, partial [Planctomycetota bacterium]